MSNIRKEYLQYEKALRDLLAIAPDLVKAKKDLFKKYGSKSDIKLFKKGKSTPYATWYSKSSIEISNTYTDYSALELSDIPDEEINDLFPEFSECSFSPGSPVFLTLDDGKEKYIAYDAKTKIFMDVESGYKTKLTSLEDCKSALFQMSVLSEVTTTPEELWLMVSVLDDWYKVKSLRKMFIVIKPECITQPTLISDMVIPE